MTTQAPSTTPWGLAQHSTTIAEGIVFVSTASHGGFWLSDERLAELPESIQQPGSYEELRGWFEEDARASIVVLCFPEAFTLDRLTVRRAIDSCKFWAERSNIRDSQGYRDALARYEANR